MNETPTVKGEGNKFRQKLDALWSDKRSYKKRLLISIALAFAICFTFLFFGPIEITAGSEGSFVFTIFDITLPLALTALAAFTILTFLIPVLRGRIFNYLVTMLFGLLLCGYIQGNFLNGSLGLLTGDAVSWHMQTSGMLLNTISWILIILAAFILLYFNKKIWRKAVLYVSLLLIVMQAVPLVTIYINAGSAEDSKEYYLSTEYMETYSPEKNTIVFLLDRLDYDYMEQVLETDPDFFAPLDGFTSFTNATSEYARTKPAANFMFTGNEELPFNVPASEAFTDSWTADGKNILKAIKDCGYDIDIYADINSLFGDAAFAKEYVNNLKAEGVSTNAKKIIQDFVCLSAYRYSPTAMKPFFWTYTDAVNKGAVVRDDMYEIDETIYAQKTESFHLEAKNNQFKFYHFNGSHAPYILKEDGTKVKGDERTSVVEQTKGSFNILYQALQKMKEQGIYKDATIIITADHGDPVHDAKPVQKATKIGLFYKPSGSEGTPLQYSKAPVSLKNLPATFLKSVGADYSKYGRPIDEIGEDEEITRHFYKTVRPEEGGHEKMLYVYDIKGDAGNFDNWELKETRPIEYPMN